jgi:endonuclease YncB( thermonuclease family)
MCTKAIEDSCITVKNVEESVEFGGQMRRIALLVLESVLLLQFASVSYGISSGRIDATAIASGVHDGDTFYIDREFYGSNTIRLADINASELGQPLSYEARDFLSELVYNDTVYLDIDNVYRFDYRGTGDRLVCVVYVSYNSTHYKNVNKALLDASLAERKDYDNEFNPDTWTLYVSKQETPELQLFPILFGLTILIVILIAVTVFVRKRGRD